MRCAGRQLLKPLLALLAVTSVYVLIKTSRTHSHSGVLGKVRNELIQIKKEFQQEGNVKVIQESDKRPPHQHGKTPAPPRKLSQAHKTATDIHEKLRNPQRNPFDSPAPSLVDLHKKAAKQQARSIDPPKPKPVVSDVKSGIPKHNNTSLRNMELKILALYKAKVKEMEKMGLGRTTTTRLCKDEPSIDRTCIDTNCSARFLEPREENIRDLLRRQYQIQAKYMEVIGKMADRKLDTTQISFVTAASENHFYECQGVIKSLIENVFPHLPDFRFFIYDLGFSSHQVKMIKKHCPVCIVKKFPFSQLPPVFSNLKSYTWKPVLVKAHLDTSQYVFWMDASVRFITQNLTTVLETVRERGMLISNSHVSTPLHTHPRMFEYFGVEPCQMSRFCEREGTFLIFHNNVFTSTAIVQSWLACAFAPNCMYPFSKDDTEGPKYSCKSEKREYGTCHRYDQSALTAILAKVFIDQIGYVSLKKNVINSNLRGDSVHYFPES